MESVLDNVFKQISAQRRLAPGCFGWMLWRFFLIVRGCETQTKRKERGISSDQVEAMPKEEKLVFQPLHFLAAEP